MGGGWLFLASLLLLAAILLHQGTLLLVSLLLFLISGISHLWARYAMNRLEYSRKLSTNRAFWGEEVNLEIGIANRKLLPLPWVRIDDELDEGITLLAGKTTPSHKPGRVVLRKLLPLGWYHRITHVYPIRCLRRGYFAFGPTRIKAGDYFGLYEREKEIQDLSYLMVYPRIVPLEELGIPSRDPFGDIRLRSHLFQDPVRAVGTRDYAYGDPLKHIHWKTTARVRRLQTKVFEHTTTMDMGLFLDVRTLAPPLWGEVPQLLETAVVAAASIASYATSHGYRVGLFVNQSYRYSNRTMRLAPSSHPDQFMHILEALAQVNSPEYFSIDKLVQREGYNLPWVSTMVVVTAAPTAALISALISFRRAGRPVSLVRVGGEKFTSSPAGLTVYHVPAEIPWEKVESVRVVPA